MVSQCGHAQRACADACMHRNRSTLIAVQGTRNIGDFGAANVKDGGDDKGGHCDEDASLDRVIELEPGSLYTFDQLSRQHCSGPGLLDPAKPKV